MMKRLLLAAAASTIAASTAIANPPAGSDPAMWALENDPVAWEITEGLTTEVGARQAGTEAEARGRAWALNYLRKAGFANVREEPFDMPTWVRGEERAWVVSPFPQKFAIAALGNSGSTGPNGLEAEVVYFPTIDDLRTAPDGSLAGKIAFVSHSMRPTQDGSSYGAFGPARFSGPNIAAKKGAAAIVIRSIGTDRAHRNPHTGNTNFEAGVTPIPAGALSIPDADNLVRMVERGKPVKLRLLLTPQNIGIQKSGNVVAELPGSNPALPPIVIACHLDSWDLGTGAIDDAAGCGIITAAASAIKGMKRQRTIRLLWAGAEEVGIWGGKAYAEANKAVPHALAMESDFGADRVWRVDFKLPETAKALSDRIAARLAPLGISRGRDQASGGADVGAIIAAQNLAIIDLQQDGSRYFDLHHTPDDTLSMIDKVQLRQNVAAWTAVLAEVANYEGELALGTKP
ncbi:M28 family peptidase [Sphingorhabdus buctiana]|uniref:Carboxypeptidase Q n=1 Tax=Sphingorhabdus buctiana TaxID=1508805 RepID=A0ABW4MD76_9SPHN